MTSEDPRFYMEVVDEALAELDKYCRGLDRSANGERLIILTVETEEPLPDIAAERLRSDAARVSEKYRGLRVDTDLLSGQRDLAQLGGRVIHVGPRNPGPVQHPDQGDPEPKVAAHQQRLLTLSQGALSFPQLLLPSPDWLPVRRVEGQYDSAAIALPDWLTSVPRDELIELRLDEDGLMLRRTVLRSEVTVLVNGRPCPPKGRDAPFERPIPDTGRLSMLGPDDRRTDLDYTITPWVDAPLAPGTGRTSEVSDRSYRTVLKVEELLSWLDIQPPPVGDTPRSKVFRVRAPALEQGFAAVSAEVLYTRATASNDGLSRWEWHVKIFRTATPQQADLLRSRFEAQASLVRHGIFGAHGNLASPPWGIVPVYVLDPPETGVADAASPRTVFGAPPTVEHPADARYGEWFGAPLGTPSTCFVVVASPYLDPAQLAPRTLEPIVTALPAFREMARTLDLWHGRNIVHCDIKPANMCLVEQSYTLVDLDSVTDLSKRVTELPYTPPYARAEILLWDRITPLTQAQLKDHDRFGFALVVLSAVAGRDWVLATLLDGQPGHRIADSQEQVHTVLRERWKDPGDGVDWAPLAEVLTQPFDPSLTRRDDWRCEDWLESAISAARAQPKAKEADVQPYRGPYAAAMANVRKECSARGLGMPERLPIVHSHIQRQRRQLARAAQRDWFVLLSLASLVVVIFSVVAIVRSV